MERAKAGNKTSPTPTGWLFRTAWPDIVAFVLGAAMVGAGIYLASGTEWTKRSDIIAYNKGVDYYVSTPPGMLPASDERPAEWPIERATAYFEQAASITNDIHLKSIALYNLGTLMGRESYAVSPVAQRLEMEAALPAAVMRLAEAVRLDPENEDAKHNLEILEKTSGDAERARAASGEGYAPGISIKGY